MESMLPRVHTKCDTSLELKVVFQPQVQVEELSIWAELRHAIVTRLWLI